METAWRVPRRDFLRWTGAALGMMAGGALVQGCSSVSQFLPGAGGATQTFTIADRAEPNNIDARNYYHFAAYSVVWRMNETLLHHDTATDEVKPALATGYKIVSPDTYEFDLRKDVKWHDGHEFTAEDVDFSYRRPWLDPKEVPEIARVEILDKNKVRIVTTGPRAYWLVQDVTLNRRIMPKHVLAGVAKDTLWETPIGTGPFKFERWDRGDKIVLAANKDYWGVKPSIDKLVFRTIPEAATRLVELEAGSVDMVIDVPETDVTRLEKVSGVGVVKSPGLGYEYLAMNLAHPMLGKTEVRQAVAYAIDKDGLLKLFPATARKTIGPISDKSWAVEKNVNPYNLDVGKAKDLLATAGAGAGFSVNLKTTLAYKEMAQVIQQNLQAVNIQTNINVLEEGTFTSDIAGGKSEMYLFGWGNIVDPDHIYWVFHSERQGGQRVNYKNDRVDELLAKGQVTVDKNQRKEMYGEAQRLIVNDAPFVFLLTKDTLRGYRSDRWNGFKEQPLPTDVHTFLNQINHK